MGFTFTIFVLFLFWPLLLGVWLLSLLEVALPVIAAVLLGCNLFLLAVLLLIRHFWAASGTMAKSYIDSFSGWRRVGLLILRYGLLLLILWEVLLVLGSLALLLWGQAWLHALLQLGA